MYDEKKRTQIVEKVISLRQKSMEGRARARTRAREVMQYLQHEPYTAAEKEEAQEFHKPLLRYAVLTAKLQSMTGNEQSNRRDTKIIADYWSNEDLSKLLGDNFDYIKEIEDFDNFLLKLWADGLCYDTGGWGRRTIEMDDFGYMTFKYRLYDTLMVHPDKEFKENSLKDCTYVVIDDWRTISEIKNKYRVPKIAANEESAWWEQIDSTLSLDNATELADNEFKIGDRFLVCDLEERRTVPVSLVETPDGEYFKLTDEEIKIYEKNKIKLNFIKQETDERIFITSVIPYFDDHIVLQEKPYPFHTKNFTMIYSGSFDWNMRKCMQPSWAYLLLDPQDRINKGKSQEVDYMIQKLGAIWHMDEYETTAVGQLQAAKGKPNTILTYKNLAKNIGKRDSGSTEAGAIQIVQSGINNDMLFFEEISNITRTLEGKTGKSGESGKLAEIKLNQSLTSTNPFYEIKAKVSEHITRDFIQLAPYVYSENDRLLPVKKGAKGSLSYELINLEMDGKVLKNIREFSARAILDNIENVPNRLQRAFNENIAFAQLLINAGYPPEQLPFMLLVKTSTIRDKQDWIEALTKGQRIMQRAKINAEANEEMKLLTDIGNQRQTQQ